jgi:hypothetical protein
VAVTDAGFPLRRHADRDSPRRARGADDDHDRLRARDLPETSGRSGSGRKGRPCSPRPRFRSSTSRTYPATSCCPRSRRCDRSRSANRSARTCSTGSRRIRPSAPSRSRPTDLGTYTALIEARLRETLALPGAGSAAGDPGPWCGTWEASGGRVGRPSGRGIRWPWARGAWTRCGRRPRADPGPFDVGRRDELRPVRET